MWNRQIGTSRARARARVPNVEVPILPIARMEGRIQQTWQRLPVELFDQPAHVGRLNRELQEARCSVAEGDCYQRVPRFRRIIE